MIEKTMRLWVTRDVSPRSRREVHDAQPTMEHGIWIARWSDGMRRYPLELGNSPLADAFPLLAPGERVPVEVTVRIADGSDRLFYAPEEK